MTDPSGDLHSKIRAARRIASRAHEDRFVTPATVTEMLHLRACSSPNDPYLTFIDESGEPRAYTAAEFDTLTRRIAAGLFSCAGIGRGDRVVTAFHNHDLAIAVYFAAWHLGASVVPLNVSEDDRRLGYVLANSGAKALFTFDDYAPRLRELARGIASLKLVIVVQASSLPCGASPDRLEACTTMLPNEICFGELLAAAPDANLAAPLAPDPDGEALVVYTSGTTGVPKGVALSQYNLAVDAWAIAQWHSLTRESRLMCVLPIHHVNGLVVTHLAPLACGGSTVLNRKFSASKFFETVRRFRIQIVSVVPTLLQFLLEATPSDFDARSAVPCLSHLICGAGPLTVELAARFEDRFGIPVCHGYGLSETTCYACFLPVEKSAWTAAGSFASLGEINRKWMRDFGYPSIGVPLGINEMAIHDEHGTPLPEGDKGEIVARGHNIMLGYCGDWKANETAFANGWFRSGDEGFFKSGENGAQYFFITGRYKELIVRGGVKISPLEVDEVLGRIPGVQAAMAVGFEHTAFGEEVGAYVVKKPGADLSQACILTACRAALPAWMCPKVVVFGETFPVTSTGKYRRNELRALFADFKDLT